MTTLTLDKVSVSIHNKDIITDINATFTGGDFSAILGANGAGKTTLLKAIMGMQPSSGNIDTQDSNGKPLNKKNFAYLCQLNKSAISLTVIEMVLLGLVSELGWYVSDEHNEKVEDILNYLELMPLASKQFSQLSGGQQQLVALAQALVSSPQVLLLDEPTSALDLKHQVHVLDITREYTKQHNVITLAVLHDLSMASRYCDTLMLLNDGKVQNIGTPKEVITSELLTPLYGVHIDVGVCNYGHIHVTPVGKHQANKKL